MIAMSLWKIIAIALGAGQMVDAATEKQVTVAKIVSNCMKVVLPDVATWKSSRQHGWFRHEQGSKKNVENSFARFRHEDLNNATLATAHVTKFCSNSVARLRRGSPFLSQSSKVHVPTSTVALTRSVSRFPCHAFPAFRSPFNSSRATVRFKDFVSTMGMLKNLGIKHFMPLSLTFAIVFGLTFPSVGQGLAAIKIGGWPLTHFCVAYIFFVQGALLKFAEVKKALSSLWPLVYGIVTALFITPLMSIPIGGLTFLRHDLLNGFVLFCNMPTTKSSGIAMVTAAGGSFSFALLVAIITNLLSVFTIPFMLSALMTGAGSLHIDPFPILRDLVSTILLPTIVGKMFGSVPAFLGFLQRCRVEISLSTLTANAFVPLLKVSQSADAIGSLSVASLASVVLVATGINVIFLAFNFFFTYVLRHPANIRKSLILMCSQKTLPTAMAVLSALPASIGNHGIVAIPCILFHFTEVMIGSLIASSMACWPVERLGNETAAIF